MSESYISLAREERTVGKGTAFPGGHIAITTVLYKRVPEILTQKAVVVGKEYQTVVIELPAGQAITNSKTWKEFCPTRFKLFFPARNFTFDKQN